MNTRDSVKNVEMHEKFMKSALCEAEKASKKGEVPIGAVIVHDGKIIARAHNLRETNFDATAHAEVVAIKKAGKKLKRWNLSDCDLYVTLEPCAMCSGAIVYSRIRTVIFGAYDLRFGCCGTLMNLVEDERLNHRASVIGGILHDECVKYVKDFFAEKRKNPRPKYTAESKK